MNRDDLGSFKRDGYVLFPSLIPKEEVSAIKLRSQSIFRISSNKIFERIGGDVFGVRNFLYEITQ